MEKLVLKFGVLVRLVGPGDQNCIPTPTGNRINVYRFVIVRSAIVTDHETLAATRSGNLRFSSRAYRFYGLCLAAQFWGYRIPDRLARPVILRRVSRN